MISIYILTYNEEIDIAPCLDSAMLSDDVIVVDSFSTDKTKDPGACLLDPYCAGFTCIL